MAEELDIAASVSDIASDLGLGGGEPEQDEVVDTGDEALETVAETETTEEVTTGKQPALDQAKPADKGAAAPVTRAAPKAWAKETHELWGKLPPEAQAQIEHREKQMLDGLSQYGESAKFGKAISDTIQPYQDVIRATGFDAPTAIKALMEAHKQMSVTDEGARTAYFAKMAKHYGIDLAKAAAGATAAADEPAYAKELRERTERLERDRNNEMTQREQEQKTRVTNAITSFADAKDEKGNLKNPHFDECWQDIVALINAGHTLDQAYEKAVFANPVTRAKEIARLQTESEANLRAKAKQEAERARNTTRTNVNSRDTRRAPTASKAGKWEETLDETMKEIKSRTTTH